MVATVQGNEKDVSNWVVKKKKRVGRVNFPFFSCGNLILCAKRLVPATLIILNINKFISCTERLHIIDKMDKACRITSTERRTDKK